MLTKSKKNVIVKLMEVKRMKTYKFYVSFESVIIYAKDIRSALSQLKKEVGLRYYDLRRVYVVNEQVRYFKEGFMCSLSEVKRQIEVGTK